MFSCLSPVENVWMSCICFLQISHVCIEKPPWVSYVIHMVYPYPTDCRAAGPENIVLDYFS